MQLAAVASNALGAVVVLVALVTGEDWLALVAAPLVLLGGGAALYLALAGRRRDG